MSSNKQIRVVEAISLLTEINKNIMMACETTIEKKNQLANFSIILKRISKMATLDDKIEYLDFCECMDSIFNNECVIEPVTLRQVK